MRCAIYARKSTDHQEMSIETQITQSKDYIKRKGWEFLKGHIYIDEAISGAEYQHRPAFFRMLNNCKQFDAVVMSESSRLGRDMNRNAFYIQEILESDCRIFYYLADQEELCDTPEQKLLISVKSYASEVERLKNAQRTRDALVKKAREGFVTGGVVYGYDNVPVYNGKLDKEGKPIQMGVRHKINEEQANVVRRIFQIYADGHGFINIAKTLNQEGIPSPRKGTQSWGPTCIREILNRERYHGVVIYGKYQKGYKRGTKIRTLRPQTEWQVIEAPELKIVDDELWDEVECRKKKTRDLYLRNTNGQLWGRPDTGFDSKYLLSGLGQCAICGGSIVVHRMGRKTRTPYYCCSYRKTRGDSVCTNDLNQKMEPINHALLDDLTSRILTPDVIDFTVRETLKIIEREIETQPDKIKSLERERHILQKELDNLLNAIVNGTTSETIVKAIEDKENRIKNLDSEIEILKNIPTGNTIDLELHSARKFIEKELKNLKDVLLSNVTKARQGLRKLLVGRITFTPITENGVRYYHLSGKWKFDPILQDMLSLTLASPTGFEPVLPA